MPKSSDDERHKMPKTKEQMPNPTIQPKASQKALQQTASPHRVAALVYDNLCTFEFGIVAEIFGLKRLGDEANLYDFKSVSLEKGLLSAHGGLHFKPTGNQKDLLAADTIIVPGWRGIDQPVPQKMCAALRTATKTGARIVSICSGIYVLGAAGLLANKNATTHWRYLAHFAKIHPNVNLHPNSLYVDEGQIVTSAGSSAGIDMCLHLVRQDYGVKTANSFARRLVMHAHRQGGQRQFIEQPVPKENEANRLSFVLDHVRSHLNQPHEIATLADMAGMSGRSFQRKFSAMIGMPVGRWLKQERLVRARELLETTQANVEEISEAVGVNNVEALRYHFRQTLGVSPGQYRKRFAS